MDKESEYSVSKNSNQNLESNSTIQMYLDFMSLSFHSKQQDSPPPSPSNSERDLMVLKNSCPPEMGMLS